MQIFTWECATCKTLLWQPQRNGDQSIRSQWNLHFALAGVFPRLPLASFYSDFIGFIASFEFSVQLRLLRHATESESMSNPVALPDLYFHWFLWRVASIVIRVRGIVFWRDFTAAMLVCPTNPLAIEKAFFCFTLKPCSLITWVKILYCLGCIIYCFFWNHVSGEV